MKEEKQDHREFKELQKYFLEAIQTKDDTIFRLKCIVGLMFAVITLLVICNHLTHY